MQEAERVRFGWPRYDGKEHRRPVLEFVSPVVREEAQRVAYETLSDWRRAGRPHLRPESIKRVYRYLVTCPAFISKYVRPEADDPNKESQ